MARRVSLPGLVELEHLLPGLRLPQLQLHAVHDVDEMAVHEEFQAASDVQDLRGAPLWFGRQDAGRGECDGGRQK